MFRSRALLAAEQTWKQLFSNEKAFEIDYLRCFKDLSDPLRVLFTFKESLNNDFNDMNDTQMLKGLSIYNYIHFHSKRLMREMYVVESFWTAAKARVESGSISWNSLNLSFMCEFLVKHQSFALENFPQSTLTNVFQQAITISERMRLPHLAYVVLSSNCMPSFYPKLYEALVTKFNTTKNFTTLNSEELRVLTRALFLRPQVQQLIMKSASVSSRLFNQEVLQTLQDVVIARLNAGHLDIIHVVDIMEAFHNLTDKLSTTFDDQMMTWLLKLLDPSEDMHLAQIEMKPSQIIELAAHITPDTSMARVIFRLASNRFFLKFVMTRGPYSMTLRPNEKLPVMINYIRVAAKHKVFQIVYLDQAVNSIVEMIDSSTYKWTIKSISEALKGLAELNYAGRFNPAMISKEYQWQAWQALLARCEAAILKRVTSSATTLEEEIDDEEEIFDPAEGIEEEESLGGNRNELIDVLWAFSVFDHYSKPFLTEVLDSSMLSTGNYSEELYVKLQQINIWLKNEYMGEFKLDPQLEAEMMEYKAKWDKEPPPALPRSDLKQSIVTTLKTVKQPFTENYRDFPYLIDIAVVNEKQKECVIVEDESFYLEGSEGLIRSGLKRIELRQLTHMGWVVKRITLKAWMKFGHTDLFSKRE